jgi:hypothetical protein
MPPVPPPSEQPELFRSALVNLVDRRHPLVRLAGLIDWGRFATAFGPLYREGVGRPGLPTRLMVGLHLIKHMDASPTTPSAPASSTAPMSSSSAARPTSSTPCRSIAPP